jgi:hypothetical protein
MCVSGDRGGLRLVHLVLFLLFSFPCTSSPRRSESSAPTGCYDAFVRHISVAGGDWQTLHFTSIAAADGITAGVLLDVNAYNGCYIGKTALSCANLTACAKRLLRIIVAWSV